MYIYIYMSVYIYIYIYIYMSASLMSNCAGSPLYPIRSRMAGRPIGSEAFDGLRFRRPGIMLSRRAVG